MTLPLILLGSGVSLFTWRTLSGGTGPLANAQLFRAQALMFRYSVTEMSDTLKSSLLEPTRAEHMDRKKAANDNNGKVLEDMKLNPAIDVESQVLISELSALDDKLLNPAEDKTLELTREGKFEEARTFFRIAA